MLLTKGQSRRKVAQISASIFYPWLFLFINNTLLIYVMRLYCLLLFVFLWSCQSHISPHTKKGQSRINLKRVHTPYYITFITTSGQVPFYVNWDGKVNYMKIEVEFIIRPTSPRINFPIYDNNIFGNNYTVHRELYKVYGMNEFGATLNIFQKGDYRIRVTLFNQYWSQSKTSYFKVH